MSSFSLHLPREGKVADLMGSSYLSLSNSGLKISKEQE